MGYPMYWERLRARNHVTGGYSTALHMANSDVEQCRAMIAGDMNRVESDMQDDMHIALFAEYAGITEEQARRVLEAFFSPRLIKLMRGADGLLSR